MSAEKTIGIGIIGLGTVGGGVAQLLRDNAELYARRAGRRIEVRSVLVRNVEKARAAALVDPELVTDDPDVFFGTDGIRVVVELAGGIEHAERFVRRTLESGRHVVTANKALLAAKGPELFALAHRHGVTIGFEASCAGGIPCITAICFGLMANRISGLLGILNGTCNYMLTEMKEAGKSYEQALADAQAAGYAEADPTLDVTGRDAADKLAILSSLAFERRVAADQVDSIGIDALDADDVTAGLSAGYELKLLGVARDVDGKLSLMVEPCYVPKEGVLAGVRGPFNALFVEGDAVGKAMFYGPGAGREATASAVVSDLINTASGWYASAMSQMKLTPNFHEPADVVASGERVGTFALRSAGSQDLQLLVNVTADTARERAGEGGRAIRVIPEA
ncbi:homoserine dehydrogenase [Mucisphaera calidilacus]|uniref:Homoserine dehydrogenase n=1 Tax=Mucisphaera calidilacus TaxID=2527982 RepID=A0A518BVF4_9BACT|nr:homoserine dehydrogenase [Mucisphaera calidilacus]QDU70965.1 Homoserine dehydrogenase [Mucisphaera calidilacus]